MNWIEYLKPPLLETALDRLGLTPEDRNELRARWIDVLSDGQRLMELSILYDRYFITREDPSDCDPIDAALLALLQVPVLELTFHELKISENILNDTLQDVGRWLAKERRTTGHFGLSELRWVMHALTMELIQLGSLHFMPAPGKIPAHVFRGPEGYLIMAADGLRYREDGWGIHAEGLEDMPEFTTVFKEKDRYAFGHLIDDAGRVSPNPVYLHKGQYQPIYHPGDLVIEVHIPEGADISSEALAHAFRLATEYDKPPFIGQPAIFTCHSWMLSPQMNELVPDSRLTAFSDMWHRFALEKAESWQFWERAFDFRPVTPETAPRSTRLQRAILDHTGPLLDSAGFLFADELFPPDL